MLRTKNKLQLNERERVGMRFAGRFNAELMDFLRPHVKEGVSTGDLDKLAHEYTLDHGHTPACLGYAGPKHPYPKSICTSINDVVCHGIPSSYRLKSGDIVNVDLTTIVDGWHGDQSETFLIGKVSDEARAVTQCAFDCLYKAIGAIEPGCRISRIGEVIVAEAEERGFSVVREYVGHGLGRRFHQDPSIPHFPTRQSQRTRIAPGVCFTIEPMINTGDWGTVADDDDGWTVRTKDGGLSAQFEHTILMTEDGPEVLTFTKDGPQPGHRF